MPMISSILLTPLDVEYDSTIAVSEAGLLHDSMSLRASLVAEVMIDDDDDEKKKMSNKTRSEKV